MSKINLDFDKLTHYLASLDYQGYSFEMDNIEVFRSHGLYRYIKYRNPKNPVLWKRTKKMGVDMVIKVGNFTFYVEIRFNSTDYKQRTKWFYDSCLPRFKNYPADNTHIRLLLTNKPNNYSSVQSELQTNAIRVVTINELLSLLYEYSQRPDSIHTSIPKLDNYSVANDTNHANNITNIANVYASTQIIGVEYDITAFDMIKALLIYLHLWTRFRIRRTEDGLGLLEEINA